jgi:hypothetical protein
MSFLENVLIKIEYFQFGDDVKKAKEYLVNLCVDVEKRMSCNLGIREIAHTLRTILFDIEKFAYYTDNQLECFTLSGTLIRRGGNCLGLTTVYVAIADNLNIPIMPMLFENHIVPVYMEGGNPFPLETAKSGRIFDVSVIDLYGEKRLLLSHDEFLAVHISNRASLVYARAGLMDDAVFLIDSALEIFPTYTAGWINRAIMMKKIDNKKEMRHSIDIAKSLNPGACYTRAIEQIENNISLTN